MRVTKATAPVRRLLLDILLPWLDNLELCDPNLQGSGQVTNPIESGLPSDYAQPPLKVKSGILFYKIGQRFFFSDTRLEVIVYKLV